MASGSGLIELRETGEFVGDCGLTPQEVEGVTEIEVGYHVRRPLQRRGYATEAAAASRDFARAELGLSRLIAIIHPENVASQRVAEHIGLTLEKEVDRHQRAKTDLRRPHLLDAPPPWGGQPAETGAMRRESKRPEERPLPF